MKKLTLILTAMALVLVGATAVLAQDLPQALKGVNLNTAQGLTDAQAQQVRGCFTPYNPGISNAYGHVLDNYRNNRGNMSFNAVGVLRTLKFSGPHFLNPPYPAPPGF
jgi:hypothetical protein